MAGKKLRLPNVRKAFVPDPGYTIFDADLSGADAQVVAWEAGDEKLKKAFRSGVKIHVSNARDLWPHETKDMTNAEIQESKFYKPAKLGVHATNYGASVNSLMENNGWTKEFAEEFKERWFAAHPEILQWQQRYQRYLEGTQCWNCDNLDVVVGGSCDKCGVKLGRTIKNKFGFRYIFFDRIQDNLLPQALAWVPQSTVIFCSDLGWTAIANDEGPGFSMLTDTGELTEFSWKSYMVEPNAYEKWHEVVQPLMQVHDSIVGQVPHAYEEKIPEIVMDMRVIVPYPNDPLIIPLGVKTSRVSWGQCK